MKRNVGTVDRLIRLAVVFAILVLSLTGVFTGIWLVVLDIIGAYLLFTAIFRLCFLYDLVGIHTLRTKISSDD